MRVQTGLTGETHVKHEVARIFEVLVQPESLDARFGERRRNDLVDRNPQRRLVSGERGCFLNPAVLLALLDRAGFLQHRYRPAA